MGVLIKFTYVKDALQYVVGISNDPFEDTTDVLQYYHAAGVISNNYVMKKTLDRRGGTLVDLSHIISVNEFDPAEYCMVTGFIKSPDGTPYRNSMIEAFVWDLDYPEDFDGGYFQHPEEITYTTDTGKFEIYLKRSERFVLRVAETKFKRWFEVPDQSDIEFDDIVGTDLPIRNAW